MISRYAKISQVRHGFLGLLGTSSIQRYSKCPSACFSLDRRQPSHPGCSQHSPPAADLVTCFRGYSQGKLKLKWLKWWAFIFYKWLKIAQNGHTSHRLGTARPQLIAWHRPLEVWGMAPLILASNAILEIGSAWGCETPKPSNTWRLEDLGSIYSKRWPLSGITMVSLWQVFAASIALPYNLHNQCPFDCCALFQKSTDKHRKKTPLLC